MLKDFTLSLELEPTENRIVQTAAIFWSHDVNTAKIYIELLRKGTPIILNKDVTVRVMMLFDDENKSEHIYTAKIEDELKGLVSITLEESMRMYVGQVTCGVYVDYQNEEKTDNGYFTFGMRRSLIDKDMPELQTLYVSDFEKALKDIKEFKVDIDKNISEMDNNFNEKYDKASKNIEEIMNKIEENDLVTNETFSDNNKINKENIFFDSTVSHKDKKATLTIIDDDCRAETWTKLRPFAKKKGVPVTLAAITGQVGIKNRITYEQMLQLKKEGFEFVSHTVDHKHLAELSDEEIDYQLKESAEWLDQNGFQGNTAIVYPYGSLDSRVTSIARKYYKCAFDVDLLDGSTNPATPPLDTYKIKRVSYNTMQGQIRLDEVKQQIDEAVVNGGWVVIMTHCFYPGFETESLEEVVDYARMKGLEISNVHNAINRLGNIIDIDAETYNYQLGSDGTIIPPSILKNYVINHETPLTKFPRGKTYTIFYVSHPSNEHLPGTGIGLLETLNASQNYNYQKFLDYQTKKEYVRYWGDEWTDWEAKDDLLKEKSIEVELLNDWSGELVVKKNELGLVMVNGNLIAGRSVRTLPIFKMPYGYRSGLYYPVFNVFNHTKNKAMAGALYQSSDGSISISEKEYFDEGDSVRISFNFVTTER